MTIEFHCPGCEKLLRVKDESAGKQAQCPECGTVSRIPGPEPAAPAPVAESGNPFQSPMTESPMVSHAVAAGEIVPTPIEMGEVLGHAWVIFKERWQTVVGAVLLVGIINFIVGQVVQVVVAASDYNAGLAVLLQLGSMALSLYLTIGLFKILLAAARGQQTAFNELFTDGKLILPYFLASLLFYVIVSVGLLLLIVPGVILALMLSQYALLIIDRNVGVIDSLKLSAEITKGNKLTLLATFLVVGVGGLVLIMITCGIAALAVFPYMMLVIAIAYLKMTGQPTSAM